MTISVLVHFTQNTRDQKDFTHECPPTGSVSMISAGLANLDPSVKRGLPKKAGDWMNMNKNGIKWQMFWYSVSFKIKGIPLNMEIFGGMPEKFSIFLITICKLCLTASHRISI